MHWLRVLQNSGLAKRNNKAEPAVSELASPITEKSLATIASSLSSISNFITNGGLSGLLSGYARAQAVKDILGGLATHDGRKSLDARLVEQNALEIVSHIEAVFKKYEEKLKEPPRDPEMHDGEKSFKLREAMKLQDLEKWQEAKIKVDGI